MLQNCAKLVAVTLPASVATMNVCAFYGSDALTTITLSDTASSWTLTYDTGNPGGTKTAEEAVALLKTGITGDTYVSAVLTKNN